MSNRTIRFYATRDEFGEFSNFAAFPIRISGKVWPTSEHYFQAQKFAGTEHEEAVRRTRSPMIAARVGRDRKRPLRSDWESAKEGIMLTALRAKFSQHQNLASLLLSTGNATIVEHSKNDKYWADGGDGTGENKLGILLMQIRTELQNANRHLRAVFSKAHRDVIDRSSTVRCFPQVTLPSTSIKTGI